MSAPDAKALQIPVAIYARKSTDAKLEQEVNSISIQCAAARSYIESQRHLGWFCIDEELTDNNVSGATLERPALRRLQKLIKEEKVKVVVVNRLDRLSRSLSQFLELMAFFEEYGVALVSVTQNINTGNAMGRLMLQIIMSFAEFERELIRDRVTERMHAARKNGRFIGGSPPLGYNIKPEGRELEVNEIEAIRVHDIFLLYIELRSVKAVALELTRRGCNNKKWITREGKVTGGNPFNTSSLHNLLTNPIYIGKVTLKDEVFEGLHDGIIDSEIFEQVQSILASNSLQKGNHKRNIHNALLKGLLSCKHCDAPFTHTYTKKGASKLYRYYTCSNKRLNGAHTCPSPTIPAGEIESLVTDQLMSIGTNPELQDLVYKQLAEAIANRAKKAEQTRKTARRQLNRLTRELASSREYGASEPLIKHLEEKRLEAEDLLERAMSQTNWPKPTKKAIAAAIQDMAGLWPTFNEGEKCAFVKTLVRQVEYDAGEGSITLHFNDEGFLPKATGGDA